MRSTVSTVAPDSEVYGDYQVNNRPGRSTANENYKKQLVPVGGVLAA